MSIYEKIRRSIIGEQKAQVRSSSYGLGRAFASLVEFSESGIQVTTERAMQLTAVYQAIRILSEIPASLPIEVIEEKGRSRSPVESHPVKYLLTNKPNDLMNRFTFHELMNANIHARGNGIAIINNRKTGFAESLIPIPASDVEVKLFENQLFYLVDCKDLGIQGTFNRDEILHYKNFGLDLVWSRSPISMSREALGHALAASRFGARYFRKGGNLKAVIETEGHLDDGAFKSWRERWQTNYEGEAGDHATPILEYGMKYKPVSISAEDAQYILTRQFDIQEVARIFNLPPHLLADLSRATFSNIEHQDLQFVKYTLRPLLRRQEMELEDKLLLPKEKGVIRIRFNLDGMLRGDLASVTSHIKEMTQIGVLTRNEGRGLLNRNPLEGLDKPLDPANITGKKEQSVTEKLLENIPANGKETYM